MAESLIDLSGVGMTYEAASGPVEALAGISLTVGAGEFVSLVGPSGCGKSTLLRIVAGLRQATVGGVRVAGRTVSQPIPDIGMVFQAPILLKWRSILQNVLLPAELAGRDASGLRSRALAGRTNGKEIGIVVEHLLDGEQVALHRLQDAVEVGIQVLARTPVGEKLRRPQAGARHEDIRIIHV